MDNNVLNLLNNINGYALDDEQKSAVLSDSKNVLVVAGAGSGKTLTIIGKIRYLIEYKEISPDDILCISFTNEATKSLKNKLLQNYNYDIEVLTFHKLGLKILKDNDVYFKICPSNMLEYIVEEYFNSIIYNSETYLKDLKYYLGKNRIGKCDKEINALKKLIIRFIMLFKANNFNVKDFKVFFVKNIFSYKNYIFLKLTLTIYLLYVSELDSAGFIDFDDMLFKSTEIIRNNGNVNNYKYIIIDEYQDTSIVRYELIKAIIDRTNAKLMAVGDDFQSIYRFTGCTLDIFLNFEKYYGKTYIQKIQNTYRNSHELITIAGKFIMKNKRQVKKILRSNKKLDNPILIKYYDNFIRIFIDVIEKIYLNDKDEILVLGRNNKDIEMIVKNDNFILDGDDIIYIKNTSIKMKYLTVHKSKGLEASNVILINLEDSMTGFPNKMVDDKILRLLYKSRVSYPFDEERRLFYIALTRTKNKVYLLTPKSNPSIFVKEIAKMI